MRLSENLRSKFVFVWNPGLEDIQSLQSIQFHSKNTLQTLYKQSRQRPDDLGPKTSLSAPEFMPFNLGFHSK